MDIVALNGVPLNRVGWTLPIISDGNNCFVYGSAPSQGFSLSDLEAMNLSHQVAMVDPVSLESVLPRQKHEIALDAAGEHLSAPLYVLYIDECKLAGLGLPNEIITGGWGTRLNFASPLHYPGVTANVVNQKTLVEILAYFFEQIEPVVRNELLLRIDSQYPFRSTETDHITQLSGILYDCAYDKLSAERAIVYRGLAILLGPASHLFEEWLPRAVKKWALDANVEFWQKRIDSIKRSLRSAQALRSGVELGDLPSAKRDPINLVGKRNIFKQPTKPDWSNYSKKETMYA